MGLESTFQKAAQSTINAFGDVPKLCSYNRISQKYDSATNTKIESTKTYSGIKLIFDSFTASEVDFFSGADSSDQILPTDEKGLIAGLDLPIDEPRSGDQITKPDGTIVTVKGFYKTPATALWTLQLRGI